VQVFDAQGHYLAQWNDMYRPAALHVAAGVVYVGQMPMRLIVNATFPNIGACISLHDRGGRRLARLGDIWRGEGPGQFLAPHGMTVDSHGDIYVGEVSYAEYGSRQDPPREVRGFRKLVRTG
jgi:hypothetical protein